MKRIWIIVSGLSLIAFTTPGEGWAQRPWGERNFEGRWEIVDRGGVPNWEIDEEFKNDVFTFVRIEYSTAGYDNRFDRFGGDYFGQRSRWGRGRGRGRGRRGGWSWDTDWPESDLNFSFRLQQLTSLKVNPTPIVRRLTDEDLFDYPFIYIIEPYSGSLSFTPEEVVALRRYLLNGGFLMVDDFWSERAWEWFYFEIKKVFPDREPFELSIDHEIFHCVYNLKEKPQVPAWRDGAEYRYAQGITWEDHGPGSETVHFKAITDDNTKEGRIMVLICHNTDLGDGWEREGYDEWYFHEFCENKSYPMGINIVTYAMTH